MGACALRSTMFARSISVNNWTGSSVIATDNNYVVTTEQGWAGSDRPPPLIFVHGATYYEELVMDPILSPNHHAMILALAEYFTVFVSDFRMDQWGNIFHIELIDEAKSYLEANWGTSGPVTLVGVSMGGLGALNYTKHNPTSVRGVLGFTPVVNLQRFRDDNTSGPAAIDPCYAYSGGPTGYSDAVYGSNWNPAVWASTLDSAIPVYLMYSDTDTAIPTDTIDSFVAARPSTLVSDVGSLGHAEASLGVGLPDIIQFCRYLQKIQN